MPPYDSHAQLDLSERADYESWLLEAAFELTGDSLFPTWPDQLVYPPSGGDPQLVAYARGNIIIGDWRPHFLNAGAPLLFVTGFKILDVVAEWILEQNGTKATHKFVQKIATLRSVSSLPPLLTARAWLLDGFRALYEQLEPLRGTIIHSRHFTTTDGGITVSSSKQGVVGPPVLITQKDIRTLAVAAVSLLRYLDGTWQPDAYREKVLRKNLDDLGHLHGLPSLGQLPPAHVTVRAYALAADKQWIDLPRVRRDLERLRSRHDVVFDLRLVVVSPDRSSVSAHLLPWQELTSVQGPLMRTTEELSIFATDVPSDFDAAVVADELEAARGQNVVAG
jgi:hypothetical protein